MLENLSDFIIKHFLLIWGIVPLILLVYGLWSFYRFELKSYPDFLSATKIIKIRDRISKRSPKINSLDYLLIALFSLFLLAYCWLILYKEDFAYNDNSTYTVFSLMGKNFPFPIWTDLGRFFPLGHQEFNLIRFIDRSPTGYHAIAIVQLLIVLIALWILLKKSPIWLRLLAAISIMTAPSIVASFFGLIFPERNVIFWLTIILLCVHFFQATNSRLYSYGALIATQFALYYKEPVFIFIGSFAGLRLLKYFIFDYYKTKEKSDYKLFKTHYLEIGMLILAALFVILYLSIFLPYLDPTDSRSSGMIKVLINYLNKDKLLNIFLLTIGLRFLYLLYRKQAPDFFWDFLAVANLMYFLSYVKLQISATHYTAPVDFIAILYLVWLITPWFKTKKLPAYFLTAIVTVSILGYNISYSSYYVTNRKNVIEGKVRVTHFLENYIPQENNNVVNLFFPYTSGYHLMELSTFWEYKGLKLSQTELSDPQARLTFVVKGPRDFPQNRCIDFAPQTCIHAESPQSGDLIVVLPDDKISQEKVASLQQKAKLLLHYQPTIPFSQQTLPIFSKFTNLSDRWLHAYILIQK